MSARVFISCGQNDDIEKKCAQAIADTLRSLRFDPYVAIKSQSIADVNVGIISRLLASDYFVFVDLRRERVDVSGRVPSCRGSLYSHQELAIAHANRFEHCLFFRHEDVRLEGMAQFIMANAITFRDAESLPQLVSQEVLARQWSPTYSRHLRAGEVSRMECLYSDHRYDVPRRELVFHIEVRNMRLAEAAVGTIVRACPRDRRLIDDLLWREYGQLKWAYLSGHYEATILPRGSASFDAVAVDLENGDVRMHCASDLKPIRPIAQGAGQYELYYQVFAQGFQPLVIQMWLQVDPRFEQSEARIGLPEDIDEEVVRRVLGFEEE